MVNGSFYTLDHEQCDSIDSDLDEENHDVVNHKDNDHNSDVDNIDNEDHHDHDDEDPDDDDVGDLGDDLDESHDDDDFGVNYNYCPYMEFEERMCSDPDYLEMMVNPLEFMLGKRRRYRGYNYNPIYDIDTSNSHGYH